MSPRALITEPDMARDTARMLATVGLPPTWKVQRARPLKGRRKDELQDRLVPSSRSCCIARLVERRNAL
jgi:hypothetical protein